MTATQHIQLYNFFRQYLNIKDDAQVKNFVEEVEKIVEDKFDKEKNNFSSQSDIQELKYEINMLRQEMKTAVAEVKSELKTEINKLIIWMIGIIFTAAAFFFALAKFIH